MDPQRAKALHETVRRHHDELKRKAAESLQHKQVLDWVEPALDAIEEILEDLAAAA